MKYPFTAMPICIAIPFFCVHKGHMRIIRNIKELCTCVFLGQRIDRIQQYTVSLQLSRSSMMIVCASEMYHIYLKPKTASIFSSVNLLTSPPSLIK